MKTNILFTAAVAVITLFGAQASADIISSDAEPSTDVLVDGITGGGVGTLINASAAQGARGGALTLATDSTITGLALQAQNADTFVAGEEFTVALYSGTAGTFPAATSFANVTPGYLDANSGLTLIGSETFVATDITGDAAAGTIGSQDYVTFDFAAPIAADAGDVTALVFTNFAFSHREGTNNGGGRLQFRETTTAFNPSASRDARFSLLGTAVPEPSSLAVLGLGVVCFVTRRRRS